VVCCHLWRGSKQAPGHECKMPSLSRFYCCSVKHRSQCWLQATPWVGWTQSTTWPRDTCSARAGRVRVQNCEMIIMQGIRLAGPSPRWLHTTSAPMSPAGRPSSCHASEPPATGMHHSASHANLPHSPRLLHMTFWICWKTYCPEVRHQRSGGRLLWMSPGIVQPKMPCV
jgi:hypothetical protein